MATTNSTNPSGMPRPGGTAETKSTGNEALDDLLTRIKESGADPQRILEQLTQAQAAQAVQREGVPPCADVTLPADDVMDVRQVIFDALTAWTYPSEYLPALDELKRLIKLADALIVMTQAEIRALAPLTAAHVADQEFVTGMETALWRARNHIDDAHRKAAQAI